MKIIPLKLKYREEKGKSKARKLRSEGQVPGVVYGKKIDTIPVLVDLKELKSVIRTEAGMNVILGLEIEGTGRKTNETAVIQEIQKDPIRDNYLHVDFHKITMDEKIQATIPIAVLGESPGVKAGGVLQHSLWEVLVQCLPADIPEHFEVDVSSLEIGDSIKVADLPRSDKVEFVSPLDEVLVSVLPPTKVEIPVEAAEVAEVVEPEVIGVEEKEEEEAEKPEKAEGKEKEESQG